MASSVIAEMVELDLVTDYAVIAAFHAVVRAEAS